METTRGRVSAASARSGGRALKEESVSPGSVPVTSQCCAQEAALASFRVDESKA